MRQLFKPNLSGKGRIFRGITAVLLFAGAAFALKLSLWLALVLAASGAFVSFEALRGWCALRACGIKTKY